LEITKSPDHAELTKVYSASSGRLSARETEDTMKQKAILALAAATLIVATSAAVAADFPGAASYTPSAYGAYSWMGPYVGVNLGYEWSSVTNNPTRPKGIAGGVEAGYNWQSGPLVFGAATDLQLSAANDVLAPWKFSNPWFGTLRARMGYASNNILFYGTGGVAYGSLRSELGGASETKSSAGWTAGAGMEVGLTPGWSAKVEYLYVHLASQTYALTGSNGLGANILRFGVNYRF
jgi:outer membrane immunogenic protein